MEIISQSLAGRVGICHLLPLGFDEVDVKTSDFQLLGGYPRLLTTGMPAEVYFENYVKTHLEWDVTGLLGVRNAMTFRKFLNVMALQAGNLINYTSLSNELDVAFQTVKEWVSILRSSFVTFSLPAYQANPRKGLAKTPKLYFYDTGLLCYLLGIHSYEELLLSPSRGAVFENFVVAERAKSYIHAGKTPNLYFYRDDSKRAVDLLDFTLDNPLAIEIKATHTFHPKHARHLVPIGEDLDIVPENRLIVYEGEHSLPQRDFRTETVEKFLQTAP